MSEDNDGGSATNELVLWDRKVNVGFPDVEWLKGAVRDIVEPRRGEVVVEEEEEYEEEGEEEEYEEYEEEEGDDLMLSI